MADSMDKNTELVFKITKAVRRADQDFEEGTSRHWVRDFFLPYIRQEGVILSCHRERKKPRNLDSAGPGTARKGSISDE